MNFLDRSQRLRARRRRHETGYSRSLRVESLETRALLTVVPITLQITDLLPSISADADDPAGFSDGDYYAKIKIGNQPERSTEVLPENPVTGDHLEYPPYWEITEFIDPADFNLGLIPVQIRVFDSDLVFDDVIDITSQAGTTLTFSFDANGGTLQGQSFGNGDGDVDARLRFEMFKSTPVTFTLERFEQIDDPDPEPGDGEYEFAVKIGNMTEIVSSEYDGPNADINVGFTRYINPAQPVIDIRIRAYDKDFSFHDTMDISPASGESALTLQYDLFRRTWVEHNGLFSSPTGEAQGDGDNYRGKIKFDIVATDSDADGLFDLWETHGIDANSDGQIDLVLNSDPQHKDLFVEIDAMQGFVPQVGALNDVIAAFAAAPNALVDNPDGVDGITLHVLLDETNIPNAIWAVGFSEFDAIKQNTYPAIAGGFGTVADRASSNAANILAAKRLVYRYCIFADQYGTSGSSGQGEIQNPFQPDIIEGGNDFYVTLGPWGGGTREQQSGTFMHELGHTLGLLHGGEQVNINNDRLFNNKPN
jgi:hypothetical protein